MSHIEEPTPEDLMGINAVDQYAKAMTLTSIEAATPVRQALFDLSWDTYNFLITCRRAILETAIQTEFKPSLNWMQRDALDGGHSDR